MSLIFDVGRCCIGDKCQHPTGELRPSHECNACNQIVHLLCAMIDPLPDQWTCKNCEGNSADDDDCSATEVKICEGNSADDDDGSAVEVKICEGNSSDDDDGSTTEVPNKDTDAIKK